MYLNLHVKPQDQSERVGDSWGFRELVKAVTDNWRSIVESNYVLL
jgi:hypothetical protein